MQKSKGKGITDTLPVHMKHTAYIFLIHKKPFSPAETREKYKNLPCRSVCRGPEDLIDSEKYYLWHILTQKPWSKHTAHVSSFLFLSWWL